MGLQRYHDVSILLLLVFTACASTINAGPIGAGPCPLPNPEKVAALGHLTAILAAHLKGSAMGTSGDKNASGRICLAVFELGGDYNVHYQALVSTSKLGAPTSAFIALGKAGNAGTTVFEIAGAKAPWKDKAPPPPPTLLKNKTITPTYTYALKGTWLKASTQSFADGTTVKELVDAMMTSARDYNGGFTTASFTAGAASGMFMNDPLPAGTKKEDNKKGELVKVGVVGANPSGSNAGPTGVVKAKGSISLALLLNTTTKDYSIRYRVIMSLNNPGEPTRVVLTKGADVALIVTNSSTKWANQTLSDAELAKLAEKPAFLRKDPPPFRYSYKTTGTWLSAGTLKADNGQTYKELADAMLAAPDAYSALVYTKMIEAVAANGDFIRTNLEAGEEIVSHKDIKLSIKLKGRLGLEG